jgi:hypothetical protein
VLEPVVSLFYEMSSGRPLCEPGTEAPTRPGVILLVKEWGFLML